MGQKEIRLMVVAGLLGVAAACASSNKGSNATPAGDDAGGGESSGTSGGEEPLDGGAPAEAGQGTDGGADLAAVEAKLKVLDGWLETYRKGGTIDYNGDGKPDVTVTVNPDGSSDIQIPGSHGIRSKMHFVSTTELSDTTDQNDDGVMDATWVVTKTGATVKSVKTSDEDFDGTPDLRKTTTKNLGHTATTVERFLYALDGSGKAWTRTAAYEYDTPDEAAWECTLQSPPAAPHEERQEGASDGGTCNGYCNFGCTIPPKTTTFEPVPGTTGLFLVASGVSACTDTGTTQHRSTILTALAGLPEAMTRLGSINPDSLKAMTAFLAHVKLRIGCGGLPGCLPQNVVASTVEDDYPDEVNGPSFKTVVTTGPGQAIDEPTEAIRISAMQELLFHEMFHVFDHHDDGDLGGNNRRDRIYGCSRYMAQWKSGLKYYLGDVNDASSSRDGAVCATADHKGEFGHGQAHVEYDHVFYETAPGEPNDKELCRVDTSPVSFATCGTEHVWTYCDQTAMPGNKRSAAEVDVFECARLCPPGTTSAVPCMASQTPDPKFHRVEGCVPIPPSAY